MSTHQVLVVQLRSTHGEYTEAQPQRVDGLFVDSLEKTTLQMALKVHPLDAVIAVSGVIKALSRFGHFRQPALYRREEIMKAGLLDGLRGFGSVPGKRQAEAVLTLPDAGCEAIGEQALLFTLAAVTPYETHTQHGVVIREHLYFLNFAIPSLKIAFELDGFIKMGGDRESFQRAHHALLSRQRELEDTGWTVIRVAWEELMDLAVLRAKLIGRVARCAPAPVVPPVQGETLWNRQLITSRVAHSRTHTQSRFSNGRNGLFQISRRSQGPIPGLPTETGVIRQERDGKPGTEGESLTNLPETQGYMSSNTRRKPGKPPRHMRNGYRETLELEMR